MSGNEEFNGLDLYEVLEIDRSAPSASIRKAYLRKALKTHPDKPGGNNVEFRKVSFAYSVLQDERVRKHYDETGLFEFEEGPRIADLFSKQMRMEITPEMIAEDKLAYQNSAVERRDVYAHYTRHKGNYTKIFESVMHSTSEDHERLIAIIQEGLESEELKPFAAFKKTSSPSALAKQARKAKKEAAESAAQRAELGIETHEGLAQLIKSRQQKRAGIFDKLEAKYRVAKPKRK